MRVCLLFLFFVVLTHVLCFFINTKELIDKREDSAFLTTDKLLDLVDNSALDMRGTINLLCNDVDLREKIVVFIFTLSTRNYDRPLVNELLSKVTMCPNGTDVIESSLLDVTNPSDDAFAAVSYLDLENFWRDKHVNRYEKGYKGDDKLRRWAPEREGRGAYAHRTCDEALEFYEKAKSLFAAIRTDGGVRTRFDIDWKAWWARNGAGAKKPTKTKQASKKSLYHQQSEDDVPELPGLFESMTDEFGVEEEAGRPAGVLFKVGPTADDGHTEAV